jgi:hypothetical protein
LRYTAGDDKTFVANRQQYDDATFIGGIKSHLTLNYLMMNSVVKF